MLQVAGTGVEPLSENTELTDIDFKQYLFNKHVPSASPRSTKRKNSAILGTRLVFVLIKMNEMFRANTV